MPVTTLNMSLETWPSSADVFNHTSLASNFTKIDAHDHSSGKGVQIPTGGIANSAVTTAKIGDGQVTTVKLGDNQVTTAKIADSQVTTPKIANTGVTADKLADATRLGLTDSSVTRRGKSIIATEQTVACDGVWRNPATPDSVTVTLPTDGLMFIAFQAMWKVSSMSAGPMALVHLGNTPLAVARYAQTTANQTSAAAFLSGDNNAYASLSSHVGGLTSTGALSGFPYAGDLTTGQIIGSGTYGTPPPMPSDTPSSRPGFMTVFAAAGTYNVNVKYVGTSAGATISVKNRNLWVWTLGF